MSLSLFSILVPFSLLVSSAVLALSPFTFGLLGIWVVAASSLSTMLFHGTIAILAWCRCRRNRTQLPVDSAGEKQPSPTLKAMTLVVPAPVYAPPTHERTSKPSISIVIPVPKDQAAVPRASSRFVELGRDILHNLLSIFLLVVLTALSVIAFGKTLDTTIRGAKSDSVLPVEREETPFPWNKDVQRAECGLLGVQLVLTIIAFTLSLRGWMAKEKKLKMLRDKDDFMISP